MARFTTLRGKKITFVRTYGIQLMDGRCVAAEIRGPVTKFISNIKGLRHTSGGLITNAGDDVRKVDVCWQQDLRLLYTTVVSHSLSTTGLAYYSMLDQTRSERQSMARGRLGDIRWRTRYVAFLISTIAYCTWLTRSLAQLRV